MKVFIRFVLMLTVISILSLLLGISLVEMGVPPVYYLYVVVIVLIVSLFSAGSILEPLEELRDAFQSVVSGEIRTVTPKSTDEFGELAKAFNWMVEELRKEKESLEESERRFRSVVEEMDGWLFELDSHYCITFASPNFRDKFGDVQGKPVRDVLEHFPVEKLESGKFEYEIIKDGKITPVEVIVKKDGGTYRCLARDISTRRKIERQLAFFREILEHSVDAIVILDVDSRITVWNRGAEMMFGYTAEEAVGKPLNFLMPKERWQQCTENFKRAVVEGHVKDIEAPRIRKDGEMIIVDQTLTSIHDSNGEVIGFVAIMRDITRRKRAEIELKNTCEELERRAREILEVQNELQQLASIVENSNDAIYSVNLEGKITSWNRTAERLFGWAKEEALGMPASKLLPEEIKGETEFIIRRIREGESGLRFETRRLRKDGVVIDVEVTVSPLLNEMGELSGISIITRDISEKRQAEREAEKRMLKYEVERGRVYFADSFDTAVDVINDLIRCGYNGRVISRRYPEVLGIEEGNHLMLSAKRRDGTLEPDPDRIYREILNMPGWKNAVLLDIDYLLIKRNFEEVYELIQRLKDVFFVLNKGILVVCTESELLGEREMKLLKMECCAIKSKKIEMPAEIYEILRFVYAQNRVGERPSIKDVMTNFGITRNTAKKRVAYLAERGLIKMIKDGRMKVLEVTEEGREVMRVA